MWSWMVRCFMMSPEILVMWCSNMVGIAMTIEASKMRSSVSRKSEEDLIVDISLCGGNNRSYDCTGKVCSHLIKSRLEN